VPGSMHEIENGVAVMAPICDHIDPDRQSALVDREECGSS